MVKLWLQGAEDLDFYWDEKLLKLWKYSFEDMEKVRK